MSQSDKVTLPPCVDQASAQSKCPGHEAKSPVDNIGTHEQGSTLDLGSAIDQPSSHREEEGCRHELESIKSLSSNSESGSCTMGMAVECEIERADSLADVFDIDRTTTAPSQDEMPPSDLKDVVQDTPMCETPRSDLQVVSKVYRIWWCSFGDGKCNDTNCDHPRDSNDNWSTGWYYGKGVPDGKGNVIISYAVGTTGTESLSDPRVQTCSFSSQAFAELDKIRVGCQNVAGLHSSQLFIEQVISELKVDIFAVSETHLQQGDGKQILFSNHVFIHIPEKRRKKGCGSAGFIVSRELFGSVSVVHRHSNEHTLWLKLRGESGFAERFFCSVYIPNDTPCDELVKIWAKFIDACSEFHSKGGKVLLCGDCNCNPVRWSVRSYTQVCVT